jgi:hypothetical protein
MKGLPDCPKCGSPSLDVFRADVSGTKWAECHSCNLIVLLDKDNEIVHPHEPHPAA